MHVRQIVELTCKVSGMERRNWKISSQANRLNGMARPSISWKSLCKSLTDMPCGTTISKLFNTFFTSSSSWPILIHCTLLFQSPKQCGGRCSVPSDFCVYSNGEKQTFCRRRMFCRKCVNCSSADYAVLRTLSDDCEWCCMRSVYVWKYACILISDQLEWIFAFMCLWYLTNFHFHCRITVEWHFIFQWNDEEMKIKKLCRNYFINSRVHRTWMHYDSYAVNIRFIETDTFEHTVTYQEQVFDVNIFWIRLGFVPDSILRKLNAHSPLFSRLGTTHPIARTVRTVIDGKSEKSMRRQQ